MYILEVKRVYFMTCKNEYDKNVELHFLFVANIDCKKRVRKNYLVKSKNSIGTCK